MKITQGQIDIIHSHELTERVWQDLMDFSNYKIDDNGFSFMVDKSTIEGYLDCIDVEGLEIYGATQEEYVFLRSLISEMKTGFLFINQNGDDSDKF